MSTALAEVGHQLGKYRIVEELGTGGFATVFKAIDTTLDREVALKILHPALLADRRFVHNFRQEARTLAALRHPQIITIYEVGEIDGRILIAMERARGSSLAQAIASRKRIPWSETLDLLKPVCEALDYAHEQSIVHRDLKPANILIDTQRGALLTDFGFAKLLAENAASMSMSGGIVGTPGFIAPEVWENNTADPPADIYALGCIVYEMLTGDVLFKGQTPMQAMRAHDRGPQFPDAWPEDTPAGIADVLRKALAREPAERYRSAGALWHILNDLEAQAQAKREAAQRAAVAAQWRGEAEQALAENNVAAAKMALGRLRTLTPDDPAIPEVEARLEQRVAPSPAPTNSSLSPKSQLAAPEQVIGDLLAPAPAAAQVAPVAHEKSTLIVPDTEQTRSAPLQPDQAAERQQIVEPARLAQADGVPVPVKAGPDNQALGPMKRKPWVGLALAGALVLMVVVLVMIRGKAVPVTPISTPASTVIPRATTALAAQATAAPKPEPTTAPTVPPTAVPAAAPPTSPPQPSPTSTTTPAVPGTWHPAGLASEGDAITLQDGMVLVVEYGTAELYDPATGTWRPTGSPATDAGHATLLQDGKVLISGGADRDSNTFARAELYDPAKGTWRTTGSMATGRTGYTATLLQDGTVLVVGGLDGSGRTIASAEIYDPGTGTWRTTGDLSTVRERPTATLLPDGRVLVVGGKDDRERILASAEIYDPATGTWRRTGDLGIRRIGHTATLLQDGRVLVVGGVGNFQVLASAEIYDPAKGTWRATGSLTTSRLYHTATLLQDGRVLVVGGSGDASAELYNPATGTWRPTGSLSTARSYHSATLLNDGTVLVLGGEDDNQSVASAEVYTPPKGP